MKNNQYIQKYGEKALELYNKKSLKNSIVDDKDESSQSRIEEQRKSGRISKPQKSSSHKSLTRVSKSKSKLSVSGNDPNQFTFQRPLNPQGLAQKQKNKKKLVISGLSTPKNRYGRVTSGFEDRVGTSSTKKKGPDVRISEKLNEVLHKPKSAKSTLKQLLECLDMICQQECKLGKWVDQFREVVYQIAGQATSYRRKYKQQALKNRKLHREIEQMQARSVQEAVEVKRKPAEVVFLQQNQRLKEKIQKLEHKIENFQKKEMVLFETLDKLRSTPGSNGYPEGGAGPRKQETSIGAKMSRDFYGSLEEDSEEDSSNNLQQTE